jgi:hypothetical protein
MFRKVAIALLAASMLAAPVMAQTATPTAKPATTSSTAVKTVKADTAAVKHKKHARAHHGIRVSHKHMKGAKHARHFNANGSKHVRHFNKGNAHKVAGTPGKVVSTKPATRSN